MELFSSILIQTNNRCTRNCDHCFYGHFDFESSEKLDEKVINKSIDELAEIEYLGRVSFYGNNEPLTDERIFDIIKNAKMKLPECFHFLQTNGDLLKETDLEYLLKYLDGIQINIYSKNTNHIDTEKFGDRIRIADKTNYKISDWSNKAGLLVGIGREAQGSICLNPFQQFFISPSGFVTICSSDAFMKYPMGDIRVQSIDEIWNGSKFNQVRQALIDKKRKELPLCSKCDSNQGLLMELGKDSWMK